MAEMTEIKGNGILAKCKGVAIIITALTALVLGVLNWFKEVRDPKAKSGYTELAKQVEGISHDVQHLAETVKAQQEQIQAIFNWILFVTPESKPGKVEVKILKAIKSQKPVAMPTTRKPVKWDALQVP